MNMNIYKIAFPFKGEYYFASMDANAIANDVAERILGDCMLDVSCEHNQEFLFRFVGADKKKYLAAFSYESADMLNIYETNGKDPDAADYDEWIVEKDIPYLILRVDNNGETIFNVSDCL